MTTETKIETTRDLASDLLSKGNVELTGAHKVLADAIVKHGAKRLPTETAVENRLARANEKARTTALELGGSPEQAAAAGDAAESEIARRMGETARAVNLVGAAVRMAVGSL